MLYIVGTPIGNLEDLSLRQAKILASAEIILAEDTRSAGLVLKKITELFSFPINPEHRLISYYKEKEFEKLPEILDWLRDEKNIVLISESGMPVISDPGSLLVQHCQKNNLPYTVVPGPSAASTAVVASGLFKNEYMFIGFLPRKPNDIRHIFTKFKVTQEQFKDLILVSYESPNRIQESLTILAEILPESKVSICRELTKKFEEITNGKAEELAKREYKGEIVLVIR